MAFIKSKDEFKIFIASLLGWILIQIIGRLVRIREIGKHFYQDLEKRDRNYIFCLWHGRMFIPIFVQRGRGVVSMVSLHVDGEIIAQIVEKMGYQIARGSSSREGGKALREMVKLMRKGFPGSMFPDGPRGPKGDFKVGTLVLAQLTQAHLVPMTFAAEKAWVFNSWDRYIIPKPFSKVVVAYGEPVAVPRKLEPEQVEQLKTEMERRMNVLVMEAELYLKESWK
jgi:lysophospholipid acyltransferase (LPLAT)-like uncharacterized protein